MGRKVKPRRKPKKSPKTFLNKATNVLQKAGTYAAGGVLGYGINEGIDTVLNGGSSPNNNNPIIVLPAPAPVPGPGPITALAPVSSDLFDLKVLLLAVLVVILIVILVGVAIFWVKSREKRAVGKYKTELTSSK